jgi:hypothetical protein
MANAPAMLMSELRRVTTASNRTLSRRFSDKRAEYGGLIDNAQAAALYAASVGIRIQKFFSPEYCSALVALRPIGPGPIHPPQSRPARSGSREVILKIDTGVMDPAPFIEPGAARDAVRMARAYPFFYLFENSARALVCERMKTELGAGWWSATNVAAPVMARVASRIAGEGKHRWHESRGKHPVYYTDLDDLGRIIQRHWDAVFLRDLGDQARVQAMFTEMEELRNIVAHNNPLDANDLERLRSNYRVWVKQLKGVPNGEGVTPPESGPLIQPPAKGG